MLKTNEKWRSHPNTAIFVYPTRTYASITSARVIPASTAMHIAISIFILLGDNKT